MRTRHARRHGVLLALTLGACSAPPETGPDVVADATRDGDDARAIDARAHDASAPDASAPDARATDARATDARAPDAAPPADAALFRPVASWPVPALTGAPFASTETELGAAANVFYRTYTVAEGPADANGTRFADNEAWAEWDAMKFAWSTHGGYRDHAIAYFRTMKLDGVAGVTGTQPAGYVWSWGSREAWPDDNAFHHGVGSFHFDQQPRYINALYTYVAWTRDMDLLAAMLPRAVAAMTYLLDTMHGAAGVAADPGAANNGTSGARSSTYMDEIGSGYEDAWVNAAFFAALNDLADLETLAGDAAAHARYAALASAFGARYDAAFWNAATRRYAGWRDARGALHDAGYTYVNLEALARGLGDRDKAQRVFDWLAAPAMPITDGAHVGSTAVYACVAAPRTETGLVPQSDWDGWSDAPSGRPGYGSSVEIGGAMLWTSYYDAMARLRYVDADAAFGRFAALLARMNADAHLLAFQPPSHLYDDFGEGVGELGSSTPFPESGIAVLPFLEGFVGARPSSAGLVLTPDLPFDLLDAQAAGVNYAGHDRTLFVARGFTTDAADAADGAERLGPTDVFEQRFRATGAFNEIAVFVGTYGSTTSAVDLAVDRDDGGAGWTRLASRRRTDVPDNAWQHLALPDQPAGGTFRVRVSGAGGSIAWYRRAGAAMAGGQALRNGTAFAATFRFRAMMAPQDVVIDQSVGPTPDRLDTSLGQTFASAVPFDRVSFRVGTYVGATSGCTATLYQDVGGRWAATQTQVFRNLPDNGEVVMAFATQRAGEYLLELTSPVDGLAWYRTATDAYPGAGHYALTAGSPVAGDRWFRVFHGGYRVHVPEDHVDTVLNAGDRYVLAP